MFRTSLARLPTTTASRLSARPLAPLVSAQQSRPASSAHAISNPTLANIEKRWEAMPAQEQADLWMALRDRMTVDWTELTLQEKKAAYWIAFGPHGPRAMPPPGENWTVLWYTLAAIGASGVLFAIIKHFARGPPPTMTKEWQEKTDQYLKENRIEPITGVGGDNPGQTMVQSGPDKLSGQEKS